MFLSDSNRQQVFFIVKLLYLIQDLTQALTAIVLRNLRIDKQAPYLSKAIQDYKVAMNYCIE